MCQEFRNCGGAFGTINNSVFRLLTVGRHSCHLSFEFVLGSKVFVHSLLNEETLAVVRVPSPWNNGQLDCALNVPNAWVM